MTSVQGVNAPTQTSSTGWFYADADPEPNGTGWDGRFWPEIVGYRGQDAKSRVVPLADLPPMFEVVALPSSNDPVAELLESKASDTITDEVALVPDLSVQFSYAEPVATAPQPVTIEQVEVGQPVAVAKPVGETVLADEVASAKLGHVFAVLAVILVLIAIIVGVVL